MSQNEPGTRSPDKRSMLLTALYVAQAQEGYLSRPALERVAERLGMSLVEVYQAATFYSMFREEPAGRYHIQVCEGLSCHLAGGAEHLLEHLQHRLRIAPGQTTPDGLFTIEAVQCLAACGSSPAMRINDTLYENLTLDQVDRILDELKGG
ncbi:MAG: NAD(P)H-dependent oxidoreductase subunit E [Chloroflexi bacterium]|nr:NAD(P)H-dependent oxidoreductase subunit E [Chloroflexota bacterium]